MWYTWVQVEACWIEDSVAFACEQKWGVTLCIPVHLGALLSLSPWKPLLRCHSQAVCHGFRWKHKHLRVPVKRGGKVEMRGAFANGSEVCRLKSVDNHGLALPSPSSSFNCVVSFLYLLSFYLCRQHAEMHMCVQRACE